MIIQTCLTEEQVGKFTVIYRRCHQIVPVRIIEVREGAVRYEILEGDKKGIQMRSRYDVSQQVIACDTEAEAREECSKMSKRLGDEP